MASIAHVRYPAPTETGWEEWTHQHAMHHDAIERSLAQVLGVQPVNYLLYPFFKADIATWVRQHQAAHSRFTALLGIAGQDLTGLNLDDKTTRDAWLWQNFVEHLGASQRLGTTIV